MSTTITIKDIARRLGVAPSTVARALSDHPHISARTKTRVHAAATRMGYVEDGAARVMGGGRSTLIGLVLPDIENDFYAAMARAFADFCLEEKFQVVLSISGDDPDTEAQHLRALVGARAAGVVIVPTARPRRDSLALLQRLPVIQLIRHVRAIGADRVVIDEAAAIAGAVDHLLDRGHRRIGFIGSDARLSTGRARLGGFRSAFAARGLEPDPDLVVTVTPRPAQARDAAIAMISGRRPSALVAGGHRISLGMLEAVRALGLAVPRKLSVIAYGDAPWFEWWGRGLTAIGLPVGEVARRGGALLLERVGDETGAARTETVGTRLVVRASTARPAADPG